MVESIVMITADVIELHKMVYALRAENERLRGALSRAEAHMTSPKSGRGCVCRCPVIDGHTADCVVVAALAPPAPEEEKTNG